MTARHATVSFDDEPLILVDANDREIGYESKQRCHEGQGILHRAFSVFLFDASGEVLLQQRSAEKRLWPLTWSNACCSHPRRGETVPQAAARRLSEELGVVVPVTYLFHFRYQAAYRTAGAENELCHVYAGRLVVPPEPNRHEIAAVKLSTPDALDRDLADHPEKYTPWLALEWERIRASHWPAIEGLVAEA